MTVVEPRELHDTPRQLETPCCDQPEGTKRGPEPMIEKNGLQPMTLRVSWAPLFACGAPTVDRKTCRRLAGQGTTHRGQGPCWKHSGRKWDLSIQARGAQVTQRVEEVIARVREAERPRSIDEIFAMTAPRRRSAP